MLKTIVIGDVHGCHKELIKLMKVLKTKANYNPQEDKLIFLGDYIDRGDNPRLVVRYIRKLQKNNPNVIALMGNHEDMMIQYYNGDEYSPWFYNGYEKTIASYRGHLKEFNSDLEWMEKLPLYYEDENFIYVHAGVNSKKPMEDQNIDTLLWVRDSFIYDTNPYYKRVIFGHTPDLSSPYYTCSKNICIDTGCVFGGSLTALVIENGIEKEYYSIASIN